MLLHFQFHLLLDHSCALLPCTQLFRIIQNRRTSRSEFTKLLYNYDSNMSFHFALSHFSVATKSIGDFVCQSSKSNMEIRHWSSTDSGNIRTSLTKWSDLKRIRTLRISVCAQLFSLYRFSTRSLASGFRYQII